MIGPKYTYQAGATWPFDPLVLTNYEDADNTVGPIIAQIKAYQEAGDFDSAQEIIRQHASTLKKYCFDAAAINRYIEELRNLQIYTRQNKQQIFYEPTEERFSIFAGLHDVWIGNKGDASETHEQGTAQDYQVLEGATFIGSDGQLHTGTMPNYEALDAEIEAGQVFTIPAGYHNGGGTVRTATVVPEGTNVSLGPFRVNHITETNIPVFGATTASVTIDVPGVVEGMITTVKGENIIRCPQEIKQFFYVTAAKFEKDRADSGMAYSVWFKPAVGDWIKKYNAGTNPKSMITDISGTVVTVYWKYVTDLYYWGY